MSTLLFPDATLRSTTEQIGGNLAPMNAHAPILPRDLPRRTFTVREIEQMCEAGIMLEDERVELIFGELIPMNPKGVRHESFKLLLNLRWARLRPPDVLFIPETTFRLSPDTYVEPDFVVFPSGAGVKGLTPSSALLAVEIADSSLRFDSKIKPQVYAYFGIPELWVIDAINDKLHVFRTPIDGRYTETSVLTATQTVTPLVAPSAFALSLTELEREID
jgi:Uma2 family endonuclease